MELTRWRRAGQSAGAWRFIMCAVLCSLFGGAVAQTPRKKIPQNMFPVKPVPANPPPQAPSPRISARQLFPHALPPGGRVGEDGQFALTLAAPDNKALPVMVGNAGLPVNYPPGRFDAEAGRLRRGVCRNWFNREHVLWNFFPWSLCDGAAEKRAQYSAHYEPPGAGRLSCAPPSCEFHQASSSSGGRPAHRSRRKRLALCVT